MKQNLYGSTATKLRLYYSGMWWNFPDLSALHPAITAFASAKGGGSIPSRTKIFLTCLLLLQIHSCRRKTQCSNHCTQPATVKQ